MRFGFTLAVALCAVAHLNAQNCPGGNCPNQPGVYRGNRYWLPTIQPAGPVSVGQPANTRTVNTKRLETVLERLRLEGRPGMSPAEFEWIFGTDAAPASEVEIPVRRVGEDKAEKPETPGDPVENFGVDPSKIGRDRVSLNGERITKETAREILQSRADKLNDISGKRWVVVTGSPEHQKEVLSKFTPAMLREMNLKCYTPEQVRERELNYAVNSDEPIITVVEGDGTLVMNKTGAQNAQEHVGRALGQRYDPAKDPDAKPAKTPAVPDPASPNKSINVDSLIDLAKYLVPLLLGLWGGGWWKDHQAKKAAKEEADAKRQKQIDDLLATKQKDGV